VRLAAYKGAVRVCGSPEVAFEAVDDILKLAEALDKALPRSNLPVPDVNAVLGTAS
jgi:hypothetical protein